MGIRNTQFIVVRHHGTDNPHCHIVFNRVNFDGKVISDSNDFKRNEKVTKMLKDKYSLTYSEGKQSVKTEKLHASEKVKYEIYRAVKEALRSADTWKEFQNKLLKMGVEMEFKYKENTNEVQGIRFIKNGLSFKGSGIDRSFSWSRLDAALDQTMSRPWKMTFPKSNRTMNKVMVLLLKPGRSHRYGWRVHAVGGTDGGRERGGTPAEKEEAQERKEFVNHMYNKKL